MSYLKSLPGLLSLRIIFCFGCKPKAEEKIAEPLPIPKDTLPVQSMDTTPRFAVYSSADFGITWEAMNKGLPDSLQATCLAKVGHELVLATDNAGLFMTQHNKTSWKDISSGLAVKKINTLYVTGDEVYIGLFHQGVTMWKLKSAYWNSYNSGLPNRNVTAIVKVKDESVIGTDMGIFKSSGHIQTWNAKSIGGKVVSLQMKGDTIYAGSIKGVMMSRDGGEHWAYIHKNGAVHRITLRDAIIYALYDSGDLFRSDNWGKSFKLVNYSPREHSHVFSMVKVDDNLLMSNYYGVLRSKNDGNDWKLIYPQERYAFEDFVEDDHIVYGGTRSQQ